MDNILFTNLDGAYNSCYDMYHTVKGNGCLVRDSLKTTIGSLRGKWEGSDATVHLNNLIGIYKSVDVVVVAASQIAEAVGEKIISLQEVRKANGGSGDVGSKLPKLEEGGVIAEVPTTEAYKCDLSAESDKSMLETISSQYTSFCELFVERMNSLLSNWQSGLDRDAAQNLVSEFESAVEGNKKILKDAVDNLTIALSNIKNLAS